MITHEVTERSHPIYYVTDLQEFLGIYKIEKEALDMLESFPDAHVAVVYKTIQKLKPKEEETK